MYYKTPIERKMRLARRAKKSDSDYLHAQLVLAGQVVVRDAIVDSSHTYYFDCGCVRTYHRDKPFREQEILDPCSKHERLLDHPLRLTSAESKVDAKRWRAKGT
jgi:hypothetical protein